MKESSLTHTNYFKIQEVYVYFPQYLCIIGRGEDTGQNVSSHDCWNIKMLKQRQK